MIHPAKRSLAWWALLIVAALAGCFADVPTLYLDRWELELEGERTQVQLPTHLGRGLESRDAIYRLRTTVELPPTWRGEDVTLGIPLLPARVELLVDGRRVVSLDEHTFDSTRPLRPHRFRIDGARTNVDAVTLELVVENRWVQASWLDTVPRLSRSSHGDRWTRTVKAANVISCEISLISSLILGLVFAMRYLLARFRRTDDVEDLSKNSAFARFVFAAALLPATQLGLLYPLLGRREIAVIMLSVLFASSSSVELARSYLKLPPRPWWVLVVLAASTVGILIASGSFLDPVIALMVIVVMVGFVAYLVVLSARYWKEPRAIEVRWIAIGWGMSVAISSFDLATVLGLGAPLEGILLVPVALWLFSALLGVRLSRGYRMLSEQKFRLTAQLRGEIEKLEASNREVGQLNVELRRKVGDRSRELATALHRLNDPNAPRVHVGDTLSDHYRVIREIGAGAMGQVFEVERLADGRAFAAKVMRGRLSKDALARFTREAELTSRIDHPHVVRIVDVDVTADGQLFLVMELVAGQSLEQARDRFGDRTFALGVMSQMADALVAIHGGGVVHRDLKPANVIVEDGSTLLVKLADFGIAGLSEDVDVATGETLDAVANDARGDTALATETPRLTRTGVIMGTPLYMAPEAWRGGRAVAAPADVFAFGLIAYELLGGAGLERRVPGGPVDGLTPFAELADDVPAELLQALQGSLSERPADRPTAATLATLLRQPA